MKWNFFSQNRFECCSFAFSGPAFAIEHKICGFSKYIFFRTFRRSGSRLWPWAKKWKETFSTKIDSNSVLLHFQGLLLLLNIKLVDFQKYIFLRPAKKLNETFSTKIRSVPAGPCEPKNDFQNERFFAGSAKMSEIRICSVLLHFQGLLLLLNIKLVDFQNIFFSDFFTGLRLRPKAKKWNETFSAKIDSSAVRLHFQGLLLQMKHKICGFSKYIFFRTFCRSAPAALSQKMKGNFFNQNRFEFCSLAFSGPDVAIENKIGGYSKYFFSRFFHRSAPAD